MKKLYPYSLSFLFIIIFAGCGLYAQIPQYEKCCGTSSSQYPFKNNGGSKTQFWYNPGDFTALPPSGSITTIYFRSQYANQAGGYDNFKVLMKQPLTGTQFSTATTFETGLTTVYSVAHDSIDGSPTIGGWYAITLGTPFAYNNTPPLLLKFSMHLPSTVWDSTILRRPLPVSKKYMRLRLPLLQELPVMASGRISEWTS